ncbi:MAG: ROK family protein [Candidatus Limnocylindria bacterium]
MDEAAGRPIGPVLAIDLGGTQIRCALVTPELEVIRRHAEPTRDEAGVADVVRRICGVAVAVRDGALADGQPPAVGVGISSPGPLDPWRGVVVAPPNLAGWRDVPIAASVEDAVGLPTFLERDTNVAVMAEWQHGAAAGARDAVYVTVSTGIGGGIIVDGRPLMGLDGTAGEIGHITVDLDGPLCGDGKPGHAEAIGSGTAIAREGRLLLERGASPALAAIVQDPDTVTARDVVAAAETGDAACRQILDRAWQAVGAMCASLVNVLNPEVIVIGGSIAEHQPRLLEILRAEIDGRAFALPARRVELRRPRFGDDVSLIGLLPIVNRRLDDPAFRRVASSSMEA